MFVFVSCILIALGLSVGFWFARKWLEEKGWTKLSGWALSFSLGSAVVAILGGYDLFKNGPPQNSGAIYGFFVGIVVVSMIFGFLGWLWKKIRRRQRGDRFHIRGAVVETEDAVSKQLKGVPSRFTVGAVPVPIEVETRGFLLAGSPGTGKSQALTHALDALRANGALAVIADASGIYVSRYYDDSRRDAILNPFDSRCVRWSPLAELESVADIPALAKSLVPDGDGNAAEWNSYAQTFIEAVLEHCFSQGLGNGELFRLLVMADFAELREVCAGTPAAPLLAEGNEKMFGSVRSIAASASKFLQYLDPEVGSADGFSIRKYIQADRPGFLFLSYQQQHRDALKTMIGCAIDVAARAVLSLPPSFDRRVVFGLDELPLLGKVQSIVDLATNGRKHGAMIFAGLQTIAQLRDAYGVATAQTLMACLSSWLVLRVTDSETAEFMSSYIGEEERVVVLSSGGSSSSHSIHGGFSTSTSSSSNWQHQIKKERAVLPSEIQSMPDLRGIFNLAGPTPAAIVNIRVAPQIKRAEAFIAAPPRARVKPKKAEEKEKAAEAAEAVVAEEIDSLDLL